MLYTKSSEFCNQVFKSSIILRSFSFFFLLNDYNFLSKQCERRYVRLDFYHDVKEKKNMISFIHR